MSPLLWICFFVSGASGLALELLWMRSAGLVLGQTASTTGTVLACYFTGLGLGAAAARGVRHRPVHTYGVLELGAAAGALWSLAVFRLLNSNSAQVWLGTIGPIGGIGAVALAVLPATVCLGATLPAIGQALVGNRGAVGRCGGLLYAVNTLGGALGIAVTGFGLPALVGVSASYYLAAGGSLLAAVLALTLCQDRADAAPTVGHAEPHLAATRIRLRVVAAGAGALALALEVLWTRLFAQVLHNSVYSFSAIAVVFLVTIACGAAAASLLLRRSVPATVASGALVIAGLATTGGLLLFVRSTDGLAYVGMHSGLSQYVVRIVILAAITAGPAAMASGMVLPALWAVWGAEHGASRPLGELAAANTAGGIVGALTAGFVAMPLLGIRGTLLVIGVGYVVLADMIAPPHARLRPLAYVALLSIVLLDPLRVPLVHLRPDTEVLHATAEGANGIVTVVDDQGDLQLRLDNYYVLGGSAAAVNERRLGLVPLLLHPAPRRAAFVGLATGITASAGPALGVGETTVVELVPEVASAARTHFRTWNADLLDRDDVHLVLGDGRRFLAAGNTPFDVIVSDLFIPWHASAGNLYSREMYEAVARRLAPGGLFCQWLPLYQLTRAEFDMIAHTFLTVFPQSSLWRADFYPNRPVLGLVGQTGARTIDLDRVRDRLQRVPESSHDPLLATPEGLVMLYAGDLAAVSDIVTQAPVNTDDRPLLEFMAPRLTRMNTAGDKDWFTGNLLATFYAEVDRRLSGQPDPLFAASADVRDARHAGTALFDYAVAATGGDMDSATRLEAEVRALVPEVIVAAESTDAFATLADARRELIGLHSEQESVRRQLEAIERRLGELTSRRDTQ